MRWKPGDPRPDVKSMIRVDQAGEYGATRIYAGQLAVMGDRHDMARAISGMANQEERHRAFFDALIAQRRVRPTALQPIWRLDRPGANAPKASLRDSLVERGDMTDVCP